MKLRKREERIRDALLRDIKKLNKAIAEDCGDLGLNIESNNIVFKKRGSVYFVADPDENGNTAHGDITYSVFGKPKSASVCFWKDGKAYLYRYRFVGQKLIRQ